MLERTKESTTEGLTRFTFTVPDAEADKMEKAILAILDIITEKPKEDDHSLYPADDVLGQSTPGIILRGFRGREGLTQKQLADAVGIKQHHISEMERNIRKISKGMAKRFAAFFHTSDKAFL